MAADPTGLAGAARRASSSHRLAQRANALAACVLAAIFAIGAFARFAGTAWDGYAGLHPDERHMIFTMSRSLEALQAQGGALAGLARWLRPDGPLSPRVEGSLYVYGDLPHLLGTLAAWIVGPGDWNARMETGRVVSAAFDSGTIIVVFVTALAAGGGRVAALCGALLFAAAPLAIQNANFYVVEASATFFGALALWAAASLARGGRPRQAAGLGLALAAAVSCKITLLLMACAVPAALAVRWSLSDRGDRLREGLVSLAIVAATAAAGTMVLNPSAFAGPFVPWPNALFLRQMRELADLTWNPAGVPFGWQWTLPGIHLRAFADLGLWAIGPATSGLAAFGAATILVRCRRDVFVRPAIPALVVVLAMGAALAWSPQPILRYALPALPALAVLGGFGAAALYASRTGSALATILLVLAIGWGEAVYRSHTGLHPRIAASHWIWRNLAPGSTIVNETPWDEEVPSSVRLVDPHAGFRYAGPGERFTMLSLHVTDADGPAKLDRMVDLLGRADLLAVSSDRQWRPMMAMRERFPMTGRYYDALFSGRLCFEPVARFVEPFRVFGLSLDDGDSQEYWRVYDRPPVVLFARTSCFSADLARRILEPGGPS